MSMLDKEKYAMRILKGNTICVPEFVLISAVTSPMFPVKLSSVIAMKPPESCSE